MNKFFRLFLNGLIITLNLLFRAVISVVVLSVVSTINNGIGFCFCVLGAVVFVFYPLLKLSLEGRKS